MAVVEREVTLADERVGARLGADREVLDSAGCRGSGEHERRDLRLIDVDAARLIEPFERPEEEGAVLLDRSAKRAAPLIARELGRILSLDVRCIQRVVAAEPEAA